MALIKDLPEKSSIASNDKFLVHTAEGKDRMVPTSVLLSNIQTGSFATKAEVDELKNSVSDGKTKVASAITAKGVSTANNATFDTMATNIGLISGSGGNPTGNAQPSDVLSGKTFSNADGMDKVGTMPNNGTDRQALGAWWGQDLGVSFDYGFYNHFPDGGHPFVWVPKDWLGSAEASDVVSGKTFTSQAGFQVTGTLDVSTLKNISNPTFKELYNNGSYQNGSIAYTIKASDKSDYDMLILFYHPARSGAVPGAFKMLHTSSNNLANGIGNVFVAMTKDVVVGTVIAGGNAAYYNQTALFGVKF